jgi:hypothetical protein
MKAASLKEIKDELKAIPQPGLLELCLVLAKYKKENKELLTYLLYEEQNEDGYIKSIKEKIDEGFAEVNRYNLFQAKKTLRKILRETTKYIRYSGKKPTETELLIYYCKKFKTSGIRYQTSTSLTNMYNRLLIKIGKIISQLHEDLQYDFLEEVKQL